jgi:hypothetical protein
MRHFHRCHLSPADVLEIADQFFPAIGVAQQMTAPRSRTFSGPLGSLRLSARPEGGHYTFIEVETDQMGESRLDRNVKKFFVEVHRQQDPSHQLAASY